MTIVGSRAVARTSGRGRFTKSSALGTVSATSVTVAYNNTGAAINTTLSVGTISAPLNVANNTTSVVVNGFHASLADFVTLDGNFGFSKTTGGDLQIAASDTSAVLTAGSFQLGVTAAKLGVIIKPNSTFALQATGTPILTLPSALGSVKATSLSVLYNNTGADVNTSVTIGSITAPVKVTDGTIAVTAIGFEATIANFVTIKGDFGFKKQGGDISIAAANASALLTAGSFTAGVKNATLAVIIKGSGGLAIQATGTPVLTLPTDLSSVINLSITNLTVSYNSTGAAINTPVVIGSITAPLNVVSGTAVAPYLSIAGSASLTIANFVTVSGDFSFSKETDATYTKIKIGAANVTGSAGADEFGLTNGTFGMVIFRNATTNAALGYAFDGRMTGFAKLGGSISAQATVVVRRNTTTLSMNENVKVLTALVPVVFGATERFAAGKAFQSISLTDAVIKIGDIVIKGSYTSQPIGPAGESVTKITSAALLFGDVDPNKALLSLTAAEVTYRAYPAGARLNGITYPNGVQRVTVVGGTINFGRVVELFGSFDIVRPVNPAPTDLTYVSFTNAGIALKKDDVDRKSVV